MNSSNCIQQKGVIEEIDNNFAKVNITSFSACANCHSKAGCGMSESTTREITVPISENEKFSIGEQVNIMMKRVMGWKATLIAYFIPFLLVLITLLILSSLNFSELTAGLGSLCTLIPYFIVLRLLRNRLSDSFSFTIHKLL